MSEWQSIETAPKDGTIVLLLRPKSKSGMFGKRVIIGAWSDELAAWVWPCDVCDEYNSDEWWLCVDNDCWADPDFTNWMPLPDPPDARL